MSTKPGKRSPNALPKYLSNYMAACVHSYVDTCPGTGVVIQAYYCNHPCLAEGRPALCGVMGGSIATAGTGLCHKRYEGPGAIKEPQ